MTHAPFCAQISEERQDPIIGQAAYAKVWLMLEYTGPWEAAAVYNNDLPGPVKAHVADIVNSYETNLTVVVFIRQHMQPLKKIRCFVGITCEEREALYQFQFDRYEELLDLDFTALRDGDPAYDTHMTAEPLYLVCTNGKQDRCCAKFGMPIYKEAARLVSEQVWHCTHIGVDQYAANMLCMPHGVYYSRVTVPEVATIIETDRKGEIYLTKTRGRTRYLPAAQIAEHYLRQQTGNTQLDAFRLLNIHNEAANTDTVRLQSIADGTIHTFTIQHEYREATSAPPSSCSSNVARNYRYEVQLLSYSQDDAKILYDVGC